MLVDADRTKDIVSAGDVHVPAEQVGNDLLRHFRAERPGDLLGDGHEELLQDLDAQAAITGIPQLLDQQPGLIPLDARGIVMRVHQDVGIDEPAVTVHGRFRGSS